MANSWKKNFLAIILFALLVNGIEITSPVSEYHSCLNGCDESTYTPGEMSTAGITFTNSESTTEETEMTTAVEETVEDVATTMMVSSKGIERSTTSKPRKFFTSTTAPTATTSKAPTLLTKSQSWNYTNPFGDFCPCDLTVNSCDLNCCCDVKDCTEKEQELFSECVPLPVASPDPRLCRQYKWVSTPNHTLILETINNNSGFLCIDRDNNPGRFALQNQKPVDSVEDFNALIRRRTVFKWPVPKSYNPQITMDSSYKAGDVLWAVKNMSLYPLSFLNSGFNTVCQSTKWIRFLNNWESSCTLAIPFMITENPPENSSEINLYKERCSRLSAYKIFKELVILSSPQLWSNMTSNICPPEVCVLAQQWLCNSKSFNECEKMEGIPPALLKGDICTYALLGLHLIVNVVGINIHSAHVYSFLSNVSFSSGIPAISRKHSVSYNWWSNEDDMRNENDKDKTIWRKSGSPGYIIGRPVMAGWKETVILGGEDFNQREAGIENGILEGIRVTPDPEGWLTVLGHKEGSHECGGNRRAVNFGHSAWWSCSLSLSQDEFTPEGCQNLKKKALSLLLGWGTIGNLSERYIASFGDSSPEKVNEWLPLKISSSDERKIKDIFHEKSDQLSENKLRKGCIGLQSSIQLELATALVGSVTNPQAKVVGAILSLGQEVEVKPHRLWVSWHPETNELFEIKTRSVESKMAEKMSDKDANSIDLKETDVHHEKKYLVLVSSVKFIDVTEPPEMEVAPPPVYHIRLPYGFFHPFLSGASAQYYCKVLYIGFILFVILLK